MKKKNISRKHWKNYRAEGVQRGGSTDNKNEKQKKNANSLLAPVLAIETRKARDLEQVVVLFLLDFAAPVPRRGEPAVDAGAGVEKVCFLEERTE